MKRKYTPIIKSRTRVKSMFAFMHEDENLEPSAFEQNNENIIVKNSENLLEQSNEGVIEQNGEWGNEGAVAQSNVQESQSAFEQGDAQNDNLIKEGAVEQNSASGATDAQSNEGLAIASMGGAKILQRTRGNVTVDKSKSDGASTKIADEPIKKMGNIVEVQSATYGATPVAKQKVTFKMWWRNLGSRIAQGWDTFIHKKGAVRFLVLLAIMVILLVALLIYTAVIRTDFGDLFKSPARAFVMSETGESAEGRMQDFSINALTDANPKNSNTAGFQYIDFTGKDLDRSYDIRSIYFRLYTEYDNLTLLISMTVYYGHTDENGDYTETEYLSIENQRVDMPQRVGKAVNLRINQSLEINSNMRLHLEFTAIETDDYVDNNATQTPYDVEFSIFDMQYLE